jgi:hypothetical protein
MSSFLPGLDATVEAVGAVRWANDGGPEEQRGMGIQFTEISDAALLMLKEYIAGKLESSLLW